MHSIKWSAGSLYAGQLITWALTIYVMRLLKPSDYGLVAMAGVFISFAMLLSEFGIGPALIQAEDLDSNKLRQSLSVIIVVCTALSLVTFLSAPFIVTLYNEPKLSGLVKLMSLQFIVLIFSTIPRALIVKKLRFKVLSFIDLTSAISGGIITLVFALYGLGATSLVLGSLGILIVRAIGVNLAEPISYRPILAMRDIRGLIRYGERVTTSRVLWFFYTSADILIVGKVLGKDMLGYYSIAAQLASIPLDKTSAILSQVALPAYSKLQNERELATRYFIKAVRVVAFLFIPLLWGMSSVGRELFAIFLGSRWEMAVPSFQLIAMIIPIRMLSTLMTPLLDGLGRPDLTVKNLTTACLVMPLAFFLGTHYGIVGVSTAWVVFFPTVFIYNAHRSLPAVGLRAKEILHATKKILLSGAIMYIAVSAVERYGFSFLNRYLATSLYISIGVGVYFGMSRWINEDGLREVLSLLNPKKIIPPGVTEELNP